ncbi:hypothetical protein GCM10017673_18320 [Streptosporangium violaceochromogenes]|nr:hypothetical protein GCM10017673_18320 [Streptosporangium violaceochromogenes]
MLGHPHGGRERVEILTALGRGGAATPPPSVIRRLQATGLITLADKGYIGAGEKMLTPYKGRNKPSSQKNANSVHAKLRAPAERANAQLKSRRVLRKLRCCSLRSGQLAKAILVLQRREAR